MPYEDFTTFTETDPNGHITIVSATEIDVSGLTRNEDAYVYKDYGVDHFGSSYTHYNDSRMNSTSNAFAMFAAYVLANDIDDAIGLWNAVPCVYYDWYYSSSGPVIELRKRDAAGTTEFDTSVVLSLDTTYYFTITRTSTQVTVDIYSDSARTTLVDTVVVSMDTTAFRYLYAVDSLNNANTPAASGSVYNLDIQEAAPTGYMTPRSKYWNM